MVFINGIIIQNTCVGTATKKKKCIVKSDCLKVALSMLCATAKQTFHFKHSKFRFNEYFISIYTRRSMNESKCGFQGFCDSVSLVFVVLDNV